MRSNLAVCLCAAVTWVSVAPSDAAEVRMGKPVAWPHIGLVLAVPVDFVPRNTFEPFDAVRAVLRENDKLVQGVTVSVFPVDKKKTHEQFARDMIGEMKKNLAIRQFKILKETSDLRIAERPCIGCSMQYTYRGVRTTAARVYFTRDVPSTGGRLCYVLTVEVGPKLGEADLLPILDAVMKSFKLTAIRRPGDVPVGEMGPAVEAAKFGFAVCPPRGWFVALLPAGLRAAQIDYTAGGMPTATLQVTVRPTPEAGTSKLLAQRHLAKALKDFPAGKVLFQGAVTLSGLEGWQFVLHREGKAKTPPSSSSGSGSKPPPKLETVTIVQSVLCAPAEGELPARTYDLVLLSHGGTAENARATMKSVSATFKLLGRPEPTEPKRPTTRPAGAEATIRE